MESVLEQPVHPQARITLRRNQGGSKEARRAQEVSAKIRARHVQEGGNRASQDRVYF